MTSSSSSSSLRSSQKQKLKLTHEKFLLRVISPAIRGQSCPICLKSLDLIADDNHNHNHRRHCHGSSMASVAVITACLHAYCLECIRKWSNLKRRCPLCNANFDSWFCKINLSSRNFLTEKLPPIEEGKTVISQSRFSSPRDSHRRMIQKLRAELNIDNRRTRQLPWRRTFGGRPGSVPLHVIAERKLQWRSSIYTRRLRAVPLSSGNCVKQNISKDGSTKERVLQRIEPWIQRELQAILEDPNPSVIVHVVASLFIASLEGKFDVHSGQFGVESCFLAPLQPFLHNLTSMFWHELRYIVCIQPCPFELLC